MLGFLETRQATFFYDATPKGGCFHKLQSENNTRFKEGKLGVTLEKSSRTYTRKRVMFSKEAVSKDVELRHGAEHVSTGSMNLSDSE